MFCDLVSCMPMAAVPRPRAATCGPVTMPMTSGWFSFRAGGGGGGRSWDQDFWVHPLPPEGPVTFVASWLEYGVTETRVELDGAVIREAAQRAVTLWPEEPEFESEGGWRSQRITAGEPGDPGR